MEMGMGLSQGDFQAQRESPGKEFGCALQSCAALLRDQMLPMAGDALIMKISDVHWVAPSDRIQLGRSSGS